MDKILYSFFDMLNVPINEMKEAVFEIGKVFGHHGLSAACQTYLLHKIEQNYGVFNLDPSLGFRDSYYGKAISESRIPSQIKQGTTSNVSVKIKRDFKGTRLKLLIVDPDNKQLWHPDPTGYRYWDSTIVGLEYRPELKKEIQVYRRQWDFNLHSNSKVGEYRALILLCKDRIILDEVGRVSDSQDEQIIDCEERTFEVVAREKEVDDSIEGT